ncbi:UNVERIFIED_CONTAM: hypothetical protein NCL1_23745 [Trichonephila clavipes]
MREYKEVNYEIQDYQITKNVELSVIPINLLSILNFLKLNPKNLVGLMNHRGGSVLAWGCKSASELVVRETTAEPTWDLDFEPSVKIGS